MSESQDNVLGYRAVGDITKEDYATLVPAVEAAIKQYGSVRLLFDLTNFKWEKVDAWGEDISFGHDNHDQIERMALVGHASWIKHLTKLAEPFYAQDAKYFEDAASAWTWVKS